MRRLAVVVLLAAVVSAGCATKPAAIYRLPALSLEAPASLVDAPATSVWNEWEATAARTPTLQDNWTGQRGSGNADARHATVLVGVRSLNENTWEPLDTHTVIGLEVDETDLSTGHGYEFGFAYSEDDDNVFGIDIDGDAMELHGGYRYTFPDTASGTQPYVGAGLSVIHVDLEGSSMGVKVSDDDTSLGAYVRAGVNWEVGERTRLGFDYRHLFITDIDLFGVDGNTDFDQLALTLGFAF